MTIARMPSDDLPDRLDASWESEKSEGRRCRGEWWLSPRSEVMELADRLAEHGARDILDIGCGMGRHTVALAREGFNVTAFDGSPSAVRQTKAWLRKERLEADVSVRSLLQFRYGQERFDAALSINVIHHACEEQVKEIVGNVAHCLKRRGVLLAIFPQWEDRGKYGVKVEDRTFVPVEGLEAGIPHFLFTRESVAEIFHEFELEQPIQVDHLHHLVILARKR